MRKLRFDHILLSTGWQRHVTLSVGDDGIVTAIDIDQAGTDSDETVSGTAVPGFINVHSHSHQRAMAGLAERAGPVDDNFWTWRETMYQFLQNIGPEEFEAITTQLYLDMLKAGYTTVAEFHYLHRDPTGRAYADPAELARRVITAANSTGIGLTLLPVIYTSSTFGDQPLTKRQARFNMGSDGAIDLIGRLKSHQPQDNRFRLGIAPHSLRATSPEEILTALIGLRHLDPTAPVHMHIAEQIGEVEDCLVWSGLRPVEWLLKHFDVDSRWCLIHATHINQRETEALARCGAIVGLCPSTEANLGDGIFPAEAFLKAGGRFGIGSDSHISIDPIMELRSLEYSQRLLTRRRAVLAEGPGKSTGRRLFDAALIGGAAAVGQPVGPIKVGSRADLIILNTDMPELFERTGDDLLDSWIFSTRLSPIQHVMVAGEWIIRNQTHPHEDRITASYRQAMQKLRAGI